MSNPEKLKGASGPAPELTKLKAIWLGLSDDARSFWQELFVSKTTQAEIRSQIAAKLKVSLRFDKQLTYFRRWAADQERRELQAERAMENERQLRAQHPDWSLDQIREEVIKASYFESLASGDHDLGLKTVVQDLNVRKISIDERRLTILEKKAAAFDRAQEALNKAKSSKGGITAETLSKIEQELKLL